MENRVATPKRSAGSPRAKGQPTAAIAHPAILAGRRLAQRRPRGDRSADTRRRAIDAVVECITEMGYPGATASEISRRSGLTWGAVQHHFGDKDGILAAVLEESFSRFTETLDEVPTGGPLGERVAGFVRCAWRHFGSPHYRTTFAILANLPPDPTAPWRERLLAAWTDVWKRSFPESRLPPGRTRSLMLYAIAVLTGLAGLQALNRASLGPIEAELGWLEETLLREIGGDAAR